MASRLYTPSNHLWFLLLARKTHCLSELCGTGLPEMLWFICYVCLQYLSPEGLPLSQRLRHNCSAHREFDILCLTGTQSVGTLLSFSRLIPRSAPSSCWNPNSSANKKISFSRSVPRLVALSPNHCLDWFHFICNTVFCPDKINGLSQV